jgi:hypothetical protein
MKLTIKRVQSEDIGALKKLVMAFNQESDVEYPEIDEPEIDRQLLDILGNQTDPYRMFLIAYDGKKPTGFFIGYVGSRIYGRPYTIAVAQELYVVPGKRGRWVGKQ